MDPFSVRVRVRGYEVDAQGHLNQAVYLQYAEHARWELLRAAGVEATDLVAAGVGPAMVETTIRYRRELCAGDEVDVSCAFEWTDRKLVPIVQRFRLTDGTTVATLDATIGLIDLTTRRLIGSPRDQVHALAESPEALGLHELPAAG